MLVGGDRGVNRCPPMLEGGKNRFWTKAKHGSTALLAESNEIRSEPGAKHGRTTLLAGSDERIRSEPGAKHGRTTLMAKSDERIPGEEFRS